LTGTEETPSAFWVSAWLICGQVRMTEAEFALRTARALASTSPDKATNFAATALARTVDPRLRYLIEPALVALGRNDAIAARKWLDRACEYDRARRERINAQRGA
jgi:hypothetical protein